MKTKLLIALFIVIAFLAYGYKPGKKYLILSDEPIDDFAVICTWYAATFHSNSQYSVKHMVVSSGEEFQCDSTLFADYQLIEIRHPIYITVNSRMEDGINVVDALRKTEYVEQRMIKYGNIQEDVRSAKNSSVTNLVYICDLPFDVFGAYEAHGIEVQRDAYRKKYGKQMRQCYEIYVSNLGKLEAIDTRRQLSTSEYVERQWQSSNWDKYE